MMNTISAQKSKIIIIIFSLLIPIISFSQTVYDANFQTINFGGTGVTVVFKSGTNGKSAGNITLYQNVITIGSQQIDAIIRTTSLSSGTVMDYFDRTGTGTGFTSNQDNWFSPQFTFGSGGGSALFNFEFILGGSYNNTTNTGTIVSLQNVRINSYDIDGNGTASSNQFNEFGGFFTSELATTATIGTTYNSTTGLTKFRSTISTNVSDPNDQTTRIRVTYNTLSKFAISVGAGATGQAYFFLDFGVGPNWTLTTNTVTAPTLDLNTTTTGNDNASNYCSSPVSYTSGGSNIAPVSSTPSSGTTLDQLKLSFTTTDVLNAASEQLLINGATSGGTIALNFANAAVISNIVLATKTYVVTATVANGESALVFTKNGSATMTIAEAESLIDAFQYNNTASPATVGVRTFFIKIRDGAYESQNYNFVASVFTPPAITVQPQNANIVGNTSTSFSVTSNATSFQWQVNPTTGTFANISNATPYSGSTTNQLTINPARRNLNNYQYRAIASNANCSVVSTSSVLAVSAALPVTWISFLAIKHEKNILLSWTTAAEQNSKNFVIQHSRDAKDYTDIGVVAASGNTDKQTSYNFEDEKPSAGVNYYRINQFDFDGRSTYSKVIKFIFTDKSSIVTILTNPVVNGTLSIKVNTSIFVSIFSSTGEAMFKEQFTQGTHLINVSSFAKGVYTMVAGNGSQRIIVR